MSKNSLAELLTLEGLISTTPPPGSVGSDSEEFASLPKVSKTKGGHKHRILWISPIMRQHLQVPNGPLDKDGLDQALAGSVHCLEHPNFFFLIFRRRRFTRRGQRLIPTTRATASGDRARASIKRRGEAQLGAKTSNKPLAARCYAQGRSCQVLVSQARLGKGRDVAE